MRIDKWIGSYYDALATFVKGASVRGSDQQTGHLFSCLSPDERVPTDHPLRSIRRMTDEALDRLSSRFDA